VKNTIHSTITRLNAQITRNAFRIFGGLALAALVTASGPAAAPPPSGNLLITRSIYTGTSATVTVGQALPGGGKALVDGSYPNVWTNEGPDGSFGVTSPIFLDQMADSGAVTTMAIPTNQVVTSFSSKSELSINLSTDGNALTFMGYAAPPNTLDVSNSDTPNHVDPTNPVKIAPVPRVVAQVNPDGSTTVTPINTYSGNNGRGVVSANGVYYTVGNAGNGSGTEPLAVINNTGVQISTPGGPAETTVVGVEKGNCHPPDANGCQYGFSVVDLGLAPDKSGKDDNFRGITIFNNTLYVTKGSGSNSVNTVFQVGTAGTLPTAATASTTPITIVPGFPTGLARNTTPPLPRFPFGIWFANATTVYVADEGDGTTANAATDAQSGLQKWILVNGTWQLAYTLQNGLNLGVQYSVPNGPNGEVYPTSFNPATDGLRNISGRVNGDGTVTIYGATSTVSASKDQGADPNKIVAITDTIAFTTASQASSEQFTTLRAAGYGEVVRGVAWTPKSFVPTNLPPTITGVTPAGSLQGTTMPVLLTGTNLSGVTSVTFSGSGITASVQSGVNPALGSSFQIPLTVTIASTADLGPHSITVTTASGSVTASGIFTVQRVPLTTPQPIVEVEQGAIKSGYAVITPDTNMSTPVSSVTYGTVSGGVVQSQAGILPGPLTTNAVLFAEVIPGIGRNLGVAMVNPYSNPSPVTLTLRDTNGNMIGTPATLTLQPLQSTAKFISELFSAATIAGGFRGNLTIQSQTGIAVTGLRFSGIQFSTLPIAGLATLTGTPPILLTAGTAANTPLPGIAGGNSAVVVPQFAMAGGWATQIALVNSGSTTTTGRIDIFDTSGNPLGVKLNGTTQSTFLYSIPASGSFVLAPRDVNGQSPF
jgi:hypothetical protein